MNPAIGIVALLMYVMPAGGPSVNQQNTFINFGLTWADPGYGPNLTEIRDYFVDRQDRDHLLFGFDLGVYSRTATGAAFGPAVSGVIDRYSSEGESLSYNQILFALSGRAYGGGAIGHGPFLRVDAGLAMIAVDRPKLPLSGWLAYEVEQRNESDELRDHSGVFLDDVTTFGIAFGPGALVGVGWSIRGDDSTWISVSTEFSAMWADGEMITSLKAGAALLF